MAARQSLAVTWHRDRVAAGGYRGAQPALRCQPGEVLGQVTGRECIAGAHRVADEDAETRLLVQRTLDQRSTAPAAVLDHCLVGSQVSHGLGQFACRGVLQSAKQEAGLIDPGEQDVRPAASARRTGTACPGSHSFER